MRSIMVERRKLKPVMSLDDVLRINQPEQVPKREQKPTDEK